MAADAKVLKYIRDARNAAGLKSDRQLSLMITGRLGQNPNPNLIQNYTRGVAIPSDEVIVQLAQIAGQDELEAMTEMMVLRSKFKPDMTPFYKKILAKITATTGALIILGVAIPAPAAAMPAPGAGASIHYATF